jgi:hypothetical protein
MWRDKRKVSVLKIHGHYNIQMESKKIADSKKKPGRPKKRAQAVQAHVLGVIHTPSCEEDIVEMVYYNPLIFRKIFQLFKAYEVSEIDVIFDREFMYFVSEDHLKKSVICVTFVAKYLNQYFCKSPVKIRMKRDGLEVLANLNKDHFRISFALRENFRSILYVHSSEYTSGLNNIYEINVISGQAIDTYKAASDTTYPIKFKLPIGSFKAILANTRKYSEILSFQKCGNGPMQLIIKNTKKGMNWSGVYDDSEKMECTTLNADDIFNVSVVIDYMKPFGTTNIDDEVFIALDKSEPLSLTCCADKRGTGNALTDYTLFVKVFTEIQGAKS